MVEGLRCKNTGRKRNEDTSKEKEMSNRIIDSGRERERGGGRERERGGGGGRQREGREREKGRGGEREWDRNRR